MKKKICVLEDDHAIRDVLNILLSEENYEVSMFSCIKDLMRARHHYTPDLYLLDVRLPDGNGIDLCRKITTDKQTHDIPVVMMSANVSSREIGIGCKAKAFVEKPFDLDHVIDSVEFAMRK